MSGFGNDPAPSGRIPFRVWFKAGNPDADPLRIGLTFVVVVALWAWSDPLWHILNWMIFSALANAGEIPATLQGFQSMLGGLLLIGFASMSRTQSWRRWRRATLAGLGLCFLFGSIIAVMHILLDLLPDLRSLASMTEEARHTAGIKSLILFPAIYLIGMAVATVTPWWLDGRAPAGKSEALPSKELWATGLLLVTLPMAVGFLVLEVVTSAGHCYPSMGIWMLGTCYAVPAMSGMRNVWYRRPDRRWAMAGSCGAGLLILAGSIPLAQSALGCRTAIGGGLTGGFSMETGMGPGLPVHLAAFLLAVGLLHIFMARNGLLPKGGLTEGPKGVLPLPQTEEHS